MPWRGMVAGSDLLEDQFPSLGWGIADWLDDLFWWMPCTNEQVRKLVWVHRIDPASGALVNRRSQFMGPKGVGKSPEAAKYAAAHQEGPVRFAGWDANGEPVGCPWDKPTPLAQIAAVSIDQTDNTYGALLELLTEHDGAAATRLNLDPGDTRTVNRGNHRRRIDKVTASAGAREGQPLTFAVLDETHLWTPASGGVKLAATIRRNVAKMGGLTLETTNAYDPSLQSVAQATDEAVAKRSPGIYQWKPQVPHLPSLRNRRDFTGATKRLNVDCHWQDHNRLFDEAQDPDMSEADVRRFFLNEIWAGADAAWTRDQWEKLTDATKIVADREQVAIGFDGAKFHDATAIVGVRLSDRHEFLVKCWERPPEVEDDQWEVPQSEVNDAMEMCFDTYKVELAYCDPPYWEDDVDKWAGQFGPVKKWWTNRPKPMAYSIRSFDELLKSGGCSNDGSDQLTTHHLNAQKRQTLIRDDEGRFLWTIQKKGPKSPAKIDARMAGILAHEAAGDAIALGALKKSSNRAWFM